MGQNNSAKIMLLLVSLLTACISKPAQIISPTPSTIPTSTVSPTETSVPTATPFPESAFSIEIVSYGEYGAMFELFYNGSNLEGTDINIVTEQNGKRKEAQIFQSVEGRYLAEMTDSFYDIGEVNTIITVKGNSETKISKTVTFDSPIPWMNYLYGDSPLSSKLSYPWDSHHLDAWDLQPVSSSQYPNADGHPVYSPCKGTIIKAEIIPEFVSGKGNDDTHTVWVLCDYTGYLVHLGHMAHEGYIKWGDNVESNTALGILHWEKVISRPHNHFQVWRIPSSSLLQQLQSYLKSGHMEYDRALVNNTNAKVIDPFNPNIILGGETLRYGFWLEDTLPEKVKEMIDNGVFRNPNAK